MWPTSRLTGEAKEGHLAIGCMDLKLAFVLLLDVLRQRLADFHTTAERDGSRHYWHLKIIEATSERYALQLPRAGDDLPLDELIGSLSSAG